jgi:hypothetical protein
MNDNASCNTPTGLDEHANTADVGEGGRRETFSIETITSTEFDSDNHATKWLAENLIVAHEPMLIAGALKTTKTLLSVSMATSLAFGKPVFGTFQVPRPVRVMFFSGESAWGTLQRAAMRMAVSMGHNLAAAENLVWSKDLPQIGNQAHMDELRRVIREQRIEVIIIDPLYFCLPGHDGGNVMVMGERLRTLSSACEDLGVTPVAVYQINKTVKNPYDPPELAQISWSGPGEWARQWMLISRRSPYVVGSGWHELWMQNGGSAGHSSLWEADVNEGVEPRRIWQTILRPAHDARHAVEINTKATKPKTLNEHMTQLPLPVRRPSAARRRA